jgi:hypothetical protein
VKDGVGIDGPACGENKRDDLDARSRAMISE